MEFDRIRLMEHLAVDCRLSLVEFCDAMQRSFSLPEFEYDCENETEAHEVLRQARSDDDAGESGQALA